jgi:hypothetical protein
MSILSDKDSNTTESNDTRTGEGTCVQRQGKWVQTLRLLLRQNILDITIKQKNDRTCTLKH